MDTVVSDFAKTTKLLLKDGCINIDDKFPFKVTEILDPQGCAEYPLDFYQRVMAGNKSVCIAVKSIDGSSGNLKNVRLESEANNCVTLPTFCTPGAVGWEKKYSSDINYVVNKIQCALRKIENRIFELVFECLIAAAKENQDDDIDSKGGYSFTNGTERVHVSHEAAIAGNVVVAVKSFNVFNDDKGPPDHDNIYFFQEHSVGILNTGGITLA